ncbi:unnamed protein product [Boreogadus saida]
MAGVFSSTLKGLHYLGFMSRVHREMVAGICLFGGEGHAKLTDLESGWMKTLGSKSSAFCKTKESAKFIRSFSVQLVESSARPVDLLLMVADDLLETQQWQLYGRWTSGSREKRTDKSERTCRTAVLCLCLRKVIFTV